MGECLLCTEPLFRVHHQQVAEHINGYIRKKGEVMLHSRGLTLNTPRGLAPMKYLEKALAGWNGIDLMYILAYIPVDTLVM